MKRFGYAFAVTALAVGLAPPARADHHFMDVGEVFLGTGGNETAQFVELRTTAGGQDKVSGHHVKLYDSDNELLETVTFASDADSATTSGAPILAATPAAETMFGVTADVEFDPQDILGGGKACFESNDFGVIDCVAWGDYSGPSLGVGNPVSPNEGVPSGAAIRRSGDTNNSRQDFDLVSPVPDGGGAPTAVVYRIGLASTTYSRNENTNPGNVSFSRAPTTTTITHTATFFSLDGSANAPDDYAAFVDEELQFDTNNSMTKGFQFVNDAVFEGPETVKLRVRNPTNGAVLSDNMNGVLTIHDWDDDTDPPKTRVTRPKHDETYARADFTKLKGTASDGPGEAAAVNVALRRTFKDGSCTWWQGDQWQDDPCGEEQWFTTAELSGDRNERWVHQLSELLPRSVGTRTKHYTAFSQAVDQNNNVEVVLKRGRNANRFEID